MQTKITTFDRQDNILKSSTGQKSLSHYVKIARKELLDKNVTKAVIQHKGQVIQFVFQDGL